MPCTADVLAGFARAGLVIGILAAGPAAAANPADPPPQPAQGSASAGDLKSDGPTQPAKLQDGQYTDANGDPTYHVTEGGKKVDWYTMSGYLRYSSNCIVCHGPDGMGSTYAPSLVDALKGMDYAHFAGIISGGKKDVNASQELVMPAFGDNRNVMCYMPDIYTYLRARSDGAIGRNRPAEHEPKPAAFAKAEDACMK
ncbi:c-type cytochrome, methanol metabolism-related [Methylobacterium pseudosasicola]|uniref:C-type cytochrome, methanol metabolism-related n=1 Tax=Methylobacterium pseudosasicola TaxID=582667 RepID=A0A1I4GHJ9_9HYPH|nr:c-type cytochrome, methanol metabolism-related [Methylobacterium pseudosasicola]SFL29508.1 c-type cytochrome, methanol metabolism-related [Methylobacterium pseudosasicola]